MRNSATRSTLVSVVQHARYEVLPTPSTEDKVLASLPTERVVTITASPGKGLEATFALAESLGSQGYDVVPHLAARMISGRSELAEI
jgi:methylenetetrahydrofolate reductase (NADPH)